jgi:hypothetical protein
MTPRLLVSYRGVFCIFTFFSGFEDCIAFITGKEAFPMPGKDLRII